MSGPVGIRFQHVIVFDYKLITCGVLLLEKEGPEVPREKTSNFRLDESEWHEQKLQEVLVKKMAVIINTSDSFSS
jgi:hypothetical protein